MDAPFADSAQPLELSAHVEALPDEFLTYVSVEYHGRRFHFAVRGAALPYEVSFLHEFGDAGQEPHAWFTIAPEAAAEPTVLQQYLYPQLVDIHARTLENAASGDPTADPVRSR